MSNDVFPKCGHPAGTDENTLWYLGYAKCRSCHRQSQRRYMQRRRAEYRQKYGSTSAKPVDVEKKAA